MQKLEVTKPAAKCSEEVSGGTSGVNVSRQVPLGELKRETGSDGTPANLVS